MRHCQCSQSAFQKGCFLMRPSHRSSRHVGVLRKGRKKLTPSFNFSHSPFWCPLCISSAHIENGCKTPKPSQSTNHTPYVKKYSSFSVHFIYSNCYASGVLSQLHQRIGPLLPWRSSRSSVLVPVERVINWLPSRYMPRRQSRRWQRPLCGYLP